MDKNSLPISKKTRRINSSEAELLRNNTVQNSESNIINFSNGTKISLRPEDISNIVGMGSRIVNSIANINEIRNQGEQRVNQIRAEIDRIYSESETYIKNLEAENKKWNDNFDKKRDLLFSIIDKVNNNPDWSDDLKKCLVESAGKIISES